MTTTTTQVFEVISTPWPDRLPLGTKIVKAEPRGDSNDQWFTRLDGKDLFMTEDGKFVLWSFEYRDITNE